MKPFLPTLLSLALLVGCTTGYGPSGMTGGYKDQQIDDHTYAVYFYGNGHTSGDRVWHFWIYRCAELTKQKGFTAFTLSPVDQKTAALWRFSPHAGAGFDMAGYRDDPADAPVLIPTKGGGGGGYYVIPGGTITTYSSRALVTMYNAPYPAEAPFLLDPDKIIDTLKSYIASDGKADVPARREILEKALLPRSKPA